MDWHPQWFMGYINSDDMMFQFVSPKLLEGAITFQALKLADWRDDPAVARHYELMQKYDGPTPSQLHRLRPDAGGDGGGDPQAEPATT